MDGWKEDEDVSFWGTSAYFRCELLVSGRVPRPIPGSSGSVCKICAFSPQKTYQKAGILHIWKIQVFGDLANTLTQGYQQDNARYIGGVTTGGEGEFFHDFCLGDNRGKPLGQVDKALINPPVYAAYPYPFTKDFWRWFSLSTRWDMLVPWWYLTQIGWKPPFFSRESLKIQWEMTWILSPKQVAWFTLSTFSAFYSNPAKDVSKTGRGGVSFLPFFIG